MAKCAWEMSHITVHLRERTGGSTLTALQVLREGDLSTLANPAFAKVIRPVNILGTAPKQPLSYHGYSIGHTVFFGGKRL